MTKKTVVIGLAGPTLDARGGKDRWQRWRPTVSIGQHDDLLVDRFELLCQEKYQWLWGPRPRRAISIRCHRTRK